MIWIVSAAIVSLVLIQAALVGKFARHFSESPDPKLDQRLTSTPIAVILAARGADPHLKNCLAELAEQDWPDYHVWFVVDDPADPAVSVYESIRRTANHWPMTLLVASEHGKNRSLKCNSILFALDRIDTRYDVIALIDADVVPDREWIRKLVRPLSDPAVGASYGMRWFSPRRRNFGSSIRAIWNAAAVVQMQVYRIPWGGSLAIRRQLLASTGIIDCWTNALFEDVLVAKQLSAHQSTVRQCRSLALVSDESSTLRATSSWIARQLLDVRLYHRNWPLVMFHGLAVGGIWLAIVGLIAASLVFGNYSTALVWCSTFAIFILANAALLGWINSSVHRTCANLKRVQTPIADSLKYLCAVAIASLVHLIALVRATTARSIRWRGIDYDVADGLRIAMRQYRPMAEVVGRRQMDESIV